MADNYLENKFDELLEHKTSKYATHKVVRPSLDSLLLKNRSYRGFNGEIKVSAEQLKEIVAVNGRVPSAKNQQVLRFRIVYDAQEVAGVNSTIKLGALLPEWHLPLKGQEPQAFIVVCSTVAENKWVDIDLGISAQSMLLKAVEMGLGGICIGAFNSSVVAQTLNLPESVNPLLVIAIGKPVETIQLLNVEAGESLKYYRKDSIHYVPKIRIDDLLL